MYTQVLTFFQPLTSWRMSEAIFVSMVWMVSNYYSSSFKQVRPVDFIVKIFFNSIFGSSHSTSFAYHKVHQSPYGFIWPLDTPICCEEVI